MGEIKNRTTGLLEALQHEVQNTHDCLRAALDMITRQEQTIQKLKKQVREEGKYSFMEVKK